MSVKEIKESVLALPPRKRHELAVWLTQIEAESGTDDDMVLATALAWRELDREEEKNEHSKTRRNLGR